MEIRKRKELRAIFDSVDVDGGGSIDFDEFTQVFRKAGGDLTNEELRKIFDDADADGGGTLDFFEFEKIMAMDMLDVLKKLGSVGEQDNHGLANVEPSTEEYLGHSLRSSAPQGADAYKLVETQYTSMKLYETRVASMQRFVSFCVMFHELGLQVQDWWSAVSFGILAYRMDRTHSIMRIATTASPISGAEVRDRMQFIAAKSSFHRIMETFRISVRNHQTKMEWMDKLSPGNSPRTIPGKFPREFDESEAKQKLIEHKDPGTDQVKDGAQLPKPPVLMDNGAGALGATDSTDAATKQAVIKPPEWRGPTADDAPPSKAPSSKQPSFFGSNFACCHADVNEVPMSIVENQMKNPPADEANIKFPPRS
jgi:hypothetical protein